MSYKPDYIHLQNLIMNAVEKLAEGHLKSSHDTTQESMSKDYGELIDFLETMYINAIMSLVGVMLQAAKHAPNAEDTTRLLTAARTIIEAQPMVANEKMTGTYKNMITELNLPDCFEHEQTTNEKVVEEALEEEEKNG